MKYFKNELNEIFGFDDDFDGVPEELNSITEEEKNKILAPKLLEVKNQRFAEINLSCQKEIESGFKSNALGESHLYQSDKQDQLNLVGVVTSGVAQPFKCSVDGGESWEWIEHTHEQLKQVLSDGAVVKATLLQKAGLLKAQVSSASSVEELDAIEW